MTCIEGRISRSPTNPAKKIEVLICIMLIRTPIGEIDYQNSPKLKLSVEGLNSLAPDATHPGPVGSPTCIYVDLLTCYG